MKAYKSKVLVSRTPRNLATIRPTNLFLPEKHTYVIGCGVSRNGPVVHFPFTACEKLVKHNHTGVIPDQKRNKATEQARQAQVRMQPSTRNHTVYRVKDPPKKNPKKTVAQFRTTPKQPET